MIRVMRSTVEMATVEMATVRIVLGGTEGDAVSARFGYPRAAVVAGFFLRPSGNGRVRRGA